MNYPSALDENGSETRHQWRIFIGSSEALGPLEDKIADFSTDE